MKKSILIITMILVVFITPIKVNAEEKDYNNGFFQIVAKNKKTNKQKNNGTDTSQWNEGYNQTQNCTGDNSILGSINDPNSVAWLLQQVFDYVLTMP